jgi:hypothetical protein
MGSYKHPNPDYDDLYDVQVTSPRFCGDCSLLYKKFSLYDFSPVVPRSRTHYGRSRIVALPTILGRTVHIESRSPSPARKLSIT